MTDLGYASTNLEAYRVTLLDLTGRFVADSSGLYVCTDGISLAAAFTNQAGTTYVQNAGTGVPCVNRTGPTVQSGATVTLAICRWQYALMQLLMGGKVATDDDDNLIGWAMPNPDEISNRRICLEAWTLAIDGENVAQYQGLPAYQHHIFPSVSWSVDDFNLSDAVNVFGLVGVVSPNRNVGNGPYDQWPDFVADADPTASPSGPWSSFLDVDIPAALCQTEQFTPGPPLSPLLAEFDVLYRAAAFEGEDGDPWLNEGTAGDAYDAVAATSAQNPGTTGSPHFVEFPEPGFEITTADEEYYFVFNGPGIEPGTGSFTAFGRFYWPAQAGVFSNVFAKITGVMGVNGAGWQIGSGTAVPNATVALIGGGTPTQAAVIDPGLLAAGEHLLVIRVDRGPDEIELFIDNVSAGTADASTVPDVTAAHEWIFGRGKTQTNRDYGLILRALTDTEITVDLPASL